MNSLILILILLQVVLPLVLIIANAVVPVSSWLGLGLRSLVLLAGLVYLFLGGLWLFPPWWTPWVLVVFWAASVVSAVRRLRARELPAHRWFKVAEPVVSVLLIAALAMLLVVPAIRGQSKPDIAVDLAAPLGPGTYYVTGGGTTSAVNPHLATRSGPKADRWRGQSHAVDLVKLNAYGFRASGIAPSDPADYYIFGMPVLAPCEGVVREAVDGLPDNMVPNTDRDNMAGNHVLLGCGEYDVLLAHLRQGSVRVAAGDRVETGKEVGEAGNSGNSAEPHLHVHVQRPGPSGRPIGGEPQWFTVDGEFLVRNDRLRVS